MSTCPTFETEGFGFNNNTAFQDRILKCLNQNFASQSSTGKGIDGEYSKSLQLLNIEIPFHF